MSGPRSRRVVERLLLGLAVLNLLVLAGDVAYHLGRLLSPPLPFR